MVVTEIHLSRKIPFQPGVNNRLKQNRLLAPEYRRMSIQLVSMLVFAVIMLESSRGLFSAGQDIFHLSNTYAELKPRSSDTWVFPKLAVDKPVQVASNAMNVLDLKVDGAGKKSPASVFGNPDKKTAVLSHFQERLSIPLEVKKKEITSIKKLAPDYLVKHFGQKFDLDARKYSKYDKYFKKYTKKYFGDDADWRWFKVQAFVESNLKASARSRVGALGVMQIMPETFSDIKKDNRFFRNKSIRNAEWNIAAGIYYNRLLLKSLSKQAAPKKRLQLMFASYNAGINRILRLVDDKQLTSNRLLDVPKSFPKETRDYLERIDVLISHYCGVSYSESNHVFASIDKKVEGEMLLPG